MTEQSKQPSVLSPEALDFAPGLLSIQESPPADGTYLIKGSSGNDFIMAGDGCTVDAPTQIYAGSGNSQIYGGAGVDQLFGGSGMDVLQGSSQQKGLML